MKVEKGIERTCQIKNGIEEKWKIKPSKLSSNESVTFDSEMDEEYWMISQLRKITWFSVN